MNSSVFFRIPIMNTTSTYYSGEMLREALDDMKVQVYGGCSKDNSSHIDTENVPTRSSLKIKRLSLKEGSEEENQL